ncbi:MAG: LysM peptidoglycan-binding domain-containing M23 family metallopeptidase [Thermodesulfobacterium sp.]|nr:LysM peptidoglycan-binding domain-containing M23 family metallopeptidase [Thermodesulfobacterium sp.]
MSGVMHIVERGDTLKKIAKKYRADVENIISFNEVSGEKIEIGDLLIIPGGRKPVSSKVYHVPLASSYFIFPAKGKISQGLHFYNAVDIANHCGTPIFAAASGRVQKIGYKAGSYGRYIRIIHPNGVVTLYAHLARVLVGPGQKISQGQIIGYMGHSGHTIPRGARGCHLHFEVRGARNFLARYKVGTQLRWR